MTDGLPAILAAVTTTPAYVFDMERIEGNLAALAAIGRAGQCRVLYAMKALPLGPVLAAAGRQLHGLAVSSLFEARLARETAGDGAELHLTTPGLRAGEFAELAGLCSHVSFNSLSQHAGLAGLAAGYSAGLRVNPGLSVAADPRYDPCRPHSQLGVDRQLLMQHLPAGIDGLHFHTMFSGRQTAPLLATLAAVEPLLRRHRQLRWLNLGGGYLYPELPATELAPLMAVWQRFREEYGLTIYLEPGKALVGNAGYLLTTVLDRFVSADRPVLVLDTSVNHHPEVFEYQTPPRLLGAVDADGDGDGDGETAILAGSSCKAGDLFGTFRFRRLPDIGERLAFADVGAYSLIKASRFNGYDLPDVWLAAQGRAALYRQAGYQAFRRQWR